MTCQLLLLGGWFYQDRQSTGEGGQPWLTFCLQDYTATFSEREDFGKKHFIQGYFHAVPALVSARKVIINHQGQKKVTRIAITEYL